MCDICAPGTYQNAAGKLSCIECPVGTYSEMTGAKALSDCKLAPAGNFAEGTGNDGFTPCLAGTFQDKPGQGACKVRRGLGWGGFEFAVGRDAPCSQPSMPAPLQARPPAPPPPPPPPAHPPPP